MAFVFDCIDFKKYLFGIDKKFRKDGLSVWVNSIPIPVDVFDNLFESSSDLFALYLDHVTAAVVLGNAISNGYIDGISLKDFPDKALVGDNFEDISNAIKVEIASDSDSYLGFINTVSNILGLDSYSIHIPNLLAALSHKGKKYSRIYCPVKIQDILDSSFTTTLDGFSNSNMDMFGNIVADELGIYRNGFCDALASIFSRLLDFKIEECNGVLSSQLKVTLLSDPITEGDDKSDRYRFERTSDGALWEPYYDSQYKVRVNTSHPYYKVISEVEGSHSLFEFLLNLAEYEAQLESNTHLKAIEGMRLAISRKLWIENDA